MRTAWRNNGLKPHLSRTFKVSRDPRFEDKLLMVERFFRDITDKRIRRDSFTSVSELELAIDLYVAQHNMEPKPFIWTASASDILAKVTRAKAVLAAASR